MNSRPPRVARQRRSAPRRQTPRGRGSAVLSLAVTLLVAIVTGPSASFADWLVTTDGERIETRGPWRVEGKRVIFNLPNGTLTALRTELVDLDQSRLASAEQPQPPAPKAVPREPALVLTDADVATASAESIAATSTGEAAEEGEAAAEAEGALSERELDLEVTSWREETVENGLRFLGTLDNGSPDFATLVSVEVSLYDEAGALIETQPARLATTSLAPGASSPFEVLFDGVYTYHDAIFTPDGRALRVRGAESAESAESAETGADAPPADQDGTATTSATSDEPPAS